MDQREMEKAKSILRVSSCTKDCKFLGFSHTDTYQAKHCPACFMQAGIIGEKFSNDKGIHDALYADGSDGLENYKYRVKVVPASGCDCGGDACKTTHVDWCSTRKETS